MIAGVLVGMQTYPAYEDDDVVNAIDNTILWIFTFEIFVKVWSEGLAPWRYADWRVNKEWKWNHFDFIIVLFCMPFLKSVTDGNAAVLRLMRLARLMKILKKVPQLQMIVMGLLGGLSR